VRVAGNGISPEVMGSPQYAGGSPWAIARIAQDWRHIAIALIAHFPETARFEQSRPKSLDQDQNVNSQMSDSQWNPILGNERAKQCRGRLSTVSAHFRCWTTIPGFRSQGSRDSLRADFLANYFAGHDDLDTAVLLTTLGIAVICHGVVHAKALRG
jgi:hypothetical protein